MYMNPVPGADQGFGGQPEVDPGTMGQMDVSYGAYGGGGYDDNTFEEEQPLLKELGVDLELIKQKVWISYDCVLPASWEDGHAQINDCAGSLCPFVEIVFYIFCYYVYVFC